MKRIFIFLVIVLGIHCASCEKILFDYRNKYCGDWYFTNIYRSWDMDNPENNSRDTGYYNGSIWYENKDHIKIEYSSNHTIEFEINKNGEITLDSYYPVGGKFSDENTVQFSLHSGGMGGGSGVTVTGKKR